MMLVYSFQICKYSTIIIHNILILLKLNRVGFTALSSDMNPSDLILLLNNVVNGFDDLTDKYELEKIKTIGDAYFCVGGLPINPQSDHPERTLRFAMDCFSVIRGFNQATNGEKVINIRLVLLLFVIFR